MRTFNLKALNRVKRCHHGLCNMFIPLLMVITLAASANNGLEEAVRYAAKEVGTASNNQLTLEQTLRFESGTTVRFDFEKTTDRGLKASYSFRLHLQGIDMSLVREVKGDGGLLFLEVPVTDPERYLQRMKENEVKGTAKFIRIGVTDSRQAQRLKTALGEAIAVANGAKWTPPGSEGGAALSEGEITSRPAWGFKWMEKLPENCSSLRPDFANQPYWIGLTDCKRVSSFEKVAPQQIARATGMYSSEGLYYIPGISSSVRFRSSSPIACVVRVDPEGSDPSDLMALREFQVNKKSQNRELVTQKVKVGSSTVRMEDIPMNFVKVAPGYFLITTDTPLASGEYAFFNTAKTFCFAFGVD